MGDGFSDARREERRAREYQAKIDGFYDAVTDYLGMNREHYTRKGLATIFEEHDAFIYPRGTPSLSWQRRPERLAAFLERIERAQIGDTVAWAEILTDAKIRASEDCFRRMHEVSVFSGKPIVVVVPSGTYHEPRILGDWREMHDALEAGNLPFARIVRMPERTIAGLQVTDEGGCVETVRAGYDDVRFISF